MKFFSVFFLSLILSGLIGCSGSVVLTPQFTANPPKTIAILPAVSIDEVARERVTAIQNAFISEMRNNGYLVLESALVESMCPNSETCRKKEIAKRYLVDGFVTLRIESVSRNNFLAGYYNQIRGTLLLTDAAGNTIATVPHLERESGGLLVESGQVLQGLSNQYNQTQDSSLSNLAERFARNLVQKMPQGPVDRGSDETAVSIENLGVTTKQPGVYEVCLKGTPHSIGFLRVNRSQSLLREVRDGSYCGIYRLEAPLSGIAVEIRSPYGNSERRTLPELDPKPCSKLTVASLDPNSNDLTFQCGPEDSCGQNTCDFTKIVIYSASSELGPFQKTKEFTRPSSLSFSTPRASIISVVSVDAKGVPSLPVMAALPQQP